MAIKIISDKVYQTRKMCYPQIAIDFCYNSRRQTFHVGNSFSVQIVLLDLFDSKMDAISYNEHFD